MIFFGVNLYILCFESDHISDYSALLHPRCISKPVFSAIDTNFNDDNMQFYLQSTFNSMYSF